MEYQVPQFIEVEDKIVGPLTLRQFIYLAGGAGLSVLIFLYIPLWVGFPLIAIVAAFSAALAFYRINGKPFIQILEAGFNFLIGSKLFIWRHADRQPTPTPITKADMRVSASSAPRLTRGKLTELAWSLDITQPGASQAGDDDDLVVPRHH
jgi:hypothetical protein